KVADGEIIFRDKCADCHKHLDSADTRSRVKAEMRELEPTGTDIWTACNTYLHKSKSGRLQGRQQFVYLGNPIEPVEFTRNMLGHVSVAAVIGRADELIGQVI